MKNLKALTLAAAALLCLNAHAKEKLVVWEEDGKAIALKSAVAEFEKGCDCEIEVSDEPMHSQYEKLIKLGPLGDGPDIVQLPSDKIAKGASEKYLSKIDFMMTDVEKYLPIASSAVSINGDFYGVPKAVETLVLFYNKDLMPDPPDNIDDMMELSRVRKKESGKLVFFNRWDDFYFVYGQIAAYGSYVFKQLNDNTYNTSDIGINTPGVKETLQFVRDIYREGLVDEDCFGVEGFRNVDSKFKTGNVLAVINGPWAAKEYYDSGVNFGVKILPKLSNGEMMRPFVGVRGYAISKWSTHHELAERFLQFISQKEHVLSRTRVSHEIAPIYEILESEELENDEMVQALAQMATIGSELPNIPEIAPVWPIMRDTLVEAMKTDKDIDKLAAEAEEKIALAVKKLHETGSYE